MLISQLIYIYSTCILARLKWFQVKWMMYWIVFALFTTVETFADVLVSW